MTVSTQRRYHPSQLDDVEDAERYRPGGYYPVSLGDAFANGRYRILHKLGSGGSSTVWLARDESSSPFKSLVTLKILTAESSSKPEDQIAELFIPFKLDGILRATDLAGHYKVQMIKDYFMQEGPNGTHLCLVYQLAGPSVRSMSDCQGKISGSKRLNGNLARKVAKQTATVVELMHSVGLIHGDLTTSNILFQCSGHVCRWSDDEVYSILGEPVTEKVRTCDHSSLEPCVPRELVSPVDTTRLSSLSLLQEDIVVIDFGQSFAANCPPMNYKPATAIHYWSPEARFESKCCAASDIWMLACAIFEIRAGYPLFDPIFGITGILKQTVETLGKLPEPWWKAFKFRQRWFEENGEPRPMEVQREERVLLLAIKSSIYQKLRGIGEQDEPLEGDEGPMIEATGTRLEEKEVLLLTDLLERMLRYRPEDRITIQEVVRHPWFNYNPTP